MKLRNIASAAVVAITAAVLIIGSAATADAKGKKKAAPAPKVSASCMFTSAAPVCATKGKMSFTYRNACYAGNDGAVVKANKACKASKAMKKGGKKAKKAKKGKK